MIETLVELHQALCRGETSPDKSGRWSKRKANYPRSEAERDPDIEE